MLAGRTSRIRPVYRFAEQVNISRFCTLLVKWAVMVLALLKSGYHLATLTAWACRFRLVASMASTEYSRS